jgi:signal transduction histidine kinase
MIWQELTLALGALALDDRQTALLKLLSTEMGEKPAAPVNLGPLARSDLEDELQVWLEDQAIDQAWEIGPVLIACGWSIDKVARLREQFNAAQFAVVIRWLCFGNSIYMLLDEVHTSAGRIAEIVRAVKSYSYLDQAPIQNVDIHAGLEDTLTILRSRLSPGIHLMRDYSPEPLKIEAYGSELNQVWTNIIDNAIYAMQGEGQIRIKTHGKDGLVFVEITDSGPGIPPEIQPRIFDPFFTTKPPGSGTGLGLNIVYNIIQKHRGQIQVFSRPGETTFQISLPMQM